MTDKMFAAIKIAHRHHYDIADYGMWASMVEMMIYAKMDYRNPKFVCPSDFASMRQQAIDRYDKRILEIKATRDARTAQRWLEARMRDEEFRKQREEEEKKRKQREERLAKTYATRLRNWLGLVIVGDNLIIKPLQNIDEFKEEGEAMHHCVYSMGYYKKAHTLIMSAKDSKGKRLATIHYDTKTNQIIQCRAACNQVPERYDEICELVRDNMKGNEKAVKAA